MAVPWELGAVKWLERDLTSHPPCQDQEIEPERGLSAALWSPDTADSLGSSPVGT